MFQTTISICALSSKDNVYYQNPPAFKIKPTFIYIFNYQFIVCIYAFFNLFFIITVTHNPYTQSVNGCLV